MTAEDVKLSFERIKDPAIVSPRGGQFGNIDSMTVIDANTLQMKLKAPQADLFAVMSDQYNFVIPKETAVKGKDAIKSAADVIGSGPYELFLDTNALIHVEWFAQLPDEIRTRSVFNPWPAMQEQWLSNPEFRKAPADRITEMIEPLVKLGASFRNQFANEQERLLCKNDAALRTC